MRPLAALAACGLLLPSCTAEGAGTDGVISLDTLANGAVHVVSSPEGVWASSGAEPWRLVEDLRIGVREGDPSYMFGSVRNVIPDALGRVWVMDSRAYELRLFDRDGTFVRTVGGEGGGPGEFGSNPCAFAGPDGEVWVESGGRWQRFDSAGVFLGGQPVTRNLGCGIRQWLPDGRFLAVNTEYDPETRALDGYYFVHDRDPSGEVSPRDTVPAPDVPESPRVQWVNNAGRVVITSYAPLSHRATGVLGPTGDFWITEGGGDYRIRRQTLTGDTLVIMERPYEPVPVPDSVRAREIAELRRERLRLAEGFDPADIPRVYPPFDRLSIATDGTLWVRRQLEDGAYGLDVFAPDGRFLGAVEPPPGFGRMLIHHVTPDYMYGRATDALDVPYVVRLAIHREP